MKIKSFAVEKLFGIFNHTIPLKTHERITIIHGLNGFGKTTMLRMLSGLFNSQLSVFRTTPFRKFIVKLDDETFLEVEKTSEKKNPIFIRLYEKGQKKAKEFKFLDQKNEVVSSLLIQKRISVDGEYVSFVDDNVTPLETQEPDWLKEIKKNINVRFIESQRLLNVSASSYRSYDSTSLSSSIPTVSAYSHEVAELIQAKLAEYGTTSYQLDKTFPVRLMQHQASSDLTDLEIRKRLDNLEETRSRLIEIGLLETDDNSDVKINSNLAIDDSTKNLLAVYIEDIDKKLHVFDEIAGKIGLLREIINRKFAYSYKEMKFNKDKGFVFTVLPSIENAPTGNISPTDLSSGEQHELVLLYELLFKVKPNSLVLIDEPELSLHVGWQAQFLEDLQEITKLANLDILLATHSPDIIQNHWDLTVELEKPKS